MNERNVKIAAVVAAGVAVIAVIVLVFTTYAGDNDADVAGDGGVSEGDPAPDGADVEPTPSPSGEEGDEHAHDDEAELDPAQTDAVVKVTRDFVTAWLKPGETKARQAAIRPYATKGFVDRMALTDTNPLPKGPLKGEPTIIAGTNYTAATLVTLADGKQYRCNLVFDPGGWKVSELVAGGATGGETGATGDESGEGTDGDGTGAGDDATPATKGP